MSDVEFEAAIRALAQRQGWTEGDLEEFLGLNRALANAAKEAVAELADHPDPVTHAAARQRLKEMA